MQTRIFKSGNSLAVRIPRELAFIDAGQDIEIERVGNTLVLRPIASTTLGGLTEILAAFPPSFMAEGRVPEEQAPRDWPAEPRQPG